MSKKLTSMVMLSGQDPDTFRNELFALRHELEQMGKIVEDEILDIILEGLPTEYSQIKLLAESNDDFPLENAM